MALTLYRVLPYLAAAAKGQEGHPLYVPPAAGAGRVDSPGRYAVLYVGDTAAGAVAEAFGWREVWSASMLRGRPAQPDTVRALARYELDDSAPVCDLDDAARLVELNLRPSRVVTRDRAVTQAWSLRLFEQNVFAGVRWWSYYNPDWGSFGLWEVSRLSLAEVEPLSLAHPAVRAAAEVLVKPLR